MREEYLKFDHLKKYISFLYPKHLDELAKVNLKRIEDLDLPLLKLFTHLSSEEILTLQKQTMEEYLIQILEDEAVDAIKISMKNWKNNQLPGIPREKVVASDITMVYNARKFTLNKFLPLYTSDINVMLSIINELEDFYTFQETIAIQTYADIQKEEIEKREYLLKQSQEMAHLGNWEYVYSENKIFWSEEMYRIYGLPVKSEAKVEAIQKLINEADFDRYNQLLKEIRKTGGVYNIEYKINRPDGEERIIAEKGELILGEPSVLKGISQDITKLKRREEDLKISLMQLQDLHEELQIAEEALKEANLSLELNIQNRTEELRKRNEELNQANKELHKINWDLDNFVYTASHDLKAPVANIEGLLTQLSYILDEKGMSEDEDIKLFMSMINLSIEKFKKTIQYLADISKVQKNVDGDTSEINLSEILQDIQESIRKEIDESKAIINVDLSKCNSINFSRKNLYSIIYNLISNAIKYRNPERPPIVNIETEKVNNFILLKISDNGLGIEENKINQIFHMFKRLHTHVEGSGIGLYIVKRIVENNGGKIEVKSEPGKGTTFYIYLQITKKSSHD